MTLATIGLALLIGFGQPMSSRSCGVERWLVKIATDSDAARIDSLPIPSSVTELGDIASPNRELPSHNRIAPEEFTVFRIRAVLRQVLPESDGDWHLVLEDTEDSTRTMVGEIPDSLCAVGSPYAHHFAEARRVLRAVPRRAIIELDGIGFFDFLHGQRGVAPNGFELHPILAVRMVAPPT